MSLTPWSDISTLACVEKSGLSHFYTFDYRPGRKGGNQTGRGVLSMQGLSYGVVRVDDENSLMSLTLQDCGQVLPGGLYYLFILYQIH